MEVITSEAKTASYDTTLLRESLRLQCLRRLCCVPCFFFYNSAFSFQFLPISAKVGSSLLLPTLFEGKEGYKLDKILKNAAMETKLLS
ncbi:hypothetical protein CK203_107697 [Vitis vinifera]|uniref:Uncharacterized protein n=1 Tax=Vitis vinifera TaxID=29760 RepID=A0A438CQX8_VITVI|nr:hypothetical protein CK203_107697 [Vitis vinifera]